MTSGVLGHSAFRAVAALAVGVAGAEVFFLLDFPLPWLLGSLTGCMIASLSGAPVGVSPLVRRYVTIVIGLMLGAIFTPDVLAKAPQWITTLIVVVAVLAVAAALAYWYCRRVLKMDRLTAVFSGLPGGLTEMVILGEENGADVRKLTLTHVIRVVVTLLSVPFFLQYGLGYTFSPVEVAEGARLWSLQDVLVLLAVATVGYLGGKAIHLPAAALTGPMFLSAAIHLAGFIEGARPDLVTIIVQVVMGAALGSRFAGVSCREVGRHMVLSAGMALMLLVVTGLAAWMMSVLTGLSFPALMLAFAPGGFAEMSLAALSMNIDPALVTTHHGVRLLVVVFVVPVGIGIWLNRRRSTHR